MQTAFNVTTLREMLDALRTAGDAEKVRLRDTLEVLGERSFAALLLMISVILISPLSGIPGVPSFGAVLILLIGAQFLWGRSHLWLPETLLRRGIGTEKWCKALSWLNRPAEWIDRHTHRRLEFLTRGVMKRVALIVCMAIALSWPLLEILPMVTSIGATSVSLFMFGIFASDGLFVVLGYVFVAVLGGGIVWFT